MLHRERMSATFPTRPIVLAAACHPDDIEFTMAGTLLLLREAGCEIHMWNLANGCLGSMATTPEETAQIRWREAQDSAALAGATAHPPLFNDLEIFYDKPSLAQTAAVLRTIRPQIILTHPPSDYMEDHQNVCRLIVTAAFSREMPHFPTEPIVAPYEAPVRIYHAAPHGLKDGLGNPFRPDVLVDISSVIERKQQMLACHRSQKDWLEISQGMGAYTAEVVRMGLEMGRLLPSGAAAEGWRRHAEIGFCSPHFDPLPSLLKDLAQPHPNTP